MPALSDHHYYQCFVPVTESLQRDQLIFRLNQLGFEGYQETDNGLWAFIDEQDFPAEDFWQLALQDFQLPADEVVIQKLAYQNWNQEWEAHFQPQVMARQVRVRAPFHEGAGSYPYEVIIEPRMAFGTGHHPTTRMMVQLMLSLHAMPDYVFDYGTGTGLLAILAEQMGATGVYANEIQEAAYQNAYLNCQHNHTRRITLSQADLDTFPPAATPYGLILANISRNTILEGLSALRQLLAPEGLLAVSGFFSHEVDHVKQQFAKHHLTPVQLLSKDKWAAGLFRFMPPPG